MALQKDYSRSIALRCLTCGAIYAFETDVKTGSITCHKCNRIYLGGKEELIHLNESLIENEKEQIIYEVKDDIKKELQKVFKKFKF